MNKIYEISAMLDSKDYYVKEYALDALRKAESLFPTTISSLQVFVQKEPDSSLKIAAIKIFKEKKVSESSSFLMENVNAHEPSVRLAIYDAISEISAEASKDSGVMIDNFYRETDPKVRSKIVKSLSVMASHNEGFFVANERIFDFFNDPDARVRANACSMTIKKDDALLKAEYMRMLKDPSGRVAAEAAASLYCAGNREVMDSVLTGIESCASDSKKSSYIYSLSKMKEKKSSDILKGLLKDKNPQVRRNAIFAIGCHGDEECIKPLIEHYFEEQKECRENLSKVVSALRKINSRAAAVETLLKINDPECDCRKRATLVKLFSQFTDETMVSNFTKFLSDEDARVRANAIEGILHLKEREIIDSAGVVKKVLVCVCDGSSRVMANAIRALYGSGITGVVTILREMLTSNIAEVQNSAKYAVSYLPEGLL